MKKILGSILLITGVLLFCSLDAKAVNDTVLVDKDDWKVTMGGFVEMDVINDSTRSLGEEPNNTAVGRPGTLSGDNARTQYSMRNSRLNFAVVPPSVGSWKTKGLIEFDFLGYEPGVNGTSPGNISEFNFLTKGTVRMRHAYFTAENDGWQFLVGQYWSLFGWDPIYVLNTVSVNPVSGTLYERIPQIRVSKTFGLVNSLNLETALATSRPAQRDGVIPGFDMGARLVYEGRRAGFTGPNADVKAQPMSLALSGTVNNFRSGSTAVGATTTAYAQATGGAVAVNGMVPIIASSGEKDTDNTLSLAGEYTTGSGYADHFPGFSGTSQLVAGTTAGLGANTNLDGALGGFNNTTGIFQLVKLQTFNIQGQYYLPKGFLENTFTTVGYGQLFSNNVEQLATANTAYKKSETYFGNVYHDFTKQIRLGVEYAVFRTTYIDNTANRDNRVMFAGWFRF